MSDLTWMAKLSDEEWALLKHRFADFTSFSIPLLMKAMVKMEILQEDDDSKAALYKEALEELSKDESLPKELRKGLAAKLKED